MTIRWGFPALGVRACSFVLCLLATANLRAQEDEENAGESSEQGSGDAAEKSANAPEESETEAAAEEAPAASAPSTVPIGVERLPPSGYPEPRVRGIVGGSMWLNMHGHQWPYMPRTGDDGSTRIAFSGNAWVDTSYQKVDAGLTATDPNIEEWRQQSRMVVRTTPTFNAPNDWFVQANGELVLIGAAPSSPQETFVADDLSVRVGRWNRFDLTAGRFQGWEIYHLGMGLDLNTVERDGAKTLNSSPVGLYGLTFLWDRPNGPGRLALHYYANDTLRFELLGQIGSSNSNELGVRPVGIFDSGVLKVKLGAEYVKSTPRQQAADRKDSTERRGVGGTVQVVLNPHFEAGVSFAHALVDTYNNLGLLNLGGSSTTTSYGGFANARVIGPLILGAGVTYTQDHNLETDATGELNDERSHLQVFGAAQYSLWDQLFFKLVLAHANAHFNPLSDPPPVLEYRNKALSARLRLLYMF